MITDKTHLDTMDDFLNSVWSNKPYTLSLENDKPKLVIPNDVLKLCAKQDMFVLDFVYRSYKKGLNGMILNVEQDINPELQISAFLGALNNSSSQWKCLGLVLCPDDAITKWHYYMTQCGKFEIKIVGPQTLPEEINEDTGTILLLSFSNIKLIESLMEYTFVSVVIDRFDNVATKIIIRKLQGSFNIGITYRNFYTHPEQKLQWTMLNWANPGCVGKLADFYEADNDNFAHFRDNYKEWWLRITWSFCDSFVRPTLEEKGNLSKILRKWGQEHNVPKYSINHINTRNTRKRKEKIEIIQSEDSDSEKNHHIPKRTKKVYNSSTSIRKKNANKIRYNTRTQEPKNKINNNLKISDKGNNSSDSADSNDTIIYEDFSVAKLNEATPEAEKDDEPPIGPLSQARPENVLVQNSTDFSDNESMSSGEQLLFSLASNGEQPTNSQVNAKAACSATNMDDASDTFLKSVAAKDDLFAHKIERTEQFLSNLLNNEECATSKSLSVIDLELSEQKILGSDIPAESDDFLREICSGKSKEDSAGTIENNNYARTTSSTSGTSSNDVDLLVAEVMEMVSK